MPAGVRERQGERDPRRVQLQLPGVRRFHRGNCAHEGRRGETAARHRPLPERARERHVGRALDPRLARRVLPRTAKHRRIDREASAVPADRKTWCWCVTAMLLEICFTDNYCFTLLYFMKKAGLATTIDLYIQQNKLFHALKVLEELRSEIAGFRV